MDARTDILVFPFNSIPLFIYTHFALFMAINPFPDKIHIIILLTLYIIILNNSIIVALVCPGYLHAKAKEARQLELCPMLSGLSIWIFLTIDNCYPLFSLLLMTIGSCALILFTRVRSISTTFTSSSKPSWSTTSPHGEVIIECP